MKRIVCIGVSAAILIGAAACGGKSGKKSSDAELQLHTEGIDECVPERVEVILTTPAEDVARFMEETEVIDAMIDECEATGDDVMVPTIQEMVVELDRRIVAYAKAYSVRSEDEFIEFCTLLDVDPDHMRDGFEVYGY